MIRTHGGVGGRGREAPSYPDYAALVIGNGKCKGSPVRSPVNEATDVVEVLRELVRMAGVKYG